eukprot:GHVN01034834.1.p2 GENE.GHVN01034834.1~~GHVN01034834.1.p2  ORF type:complete len:221 (+),score=44.58 GHVN01034834.1:1897-2559(+)
MSGVPAILAVLLSSSLISLSEAAPVPQGSCSDEETSLYEVISADCKFPDCLRTKAESHMTAFAQLDDSPDTATALSAIKLAACECRCPIEECESGKIREAEELSVMCKMHLSSICARNDKGLADNCSALKEVFPDVGVGVGECGMCSSLSEELKATYPPEEIPSFIEMETVVDDERGEDGDENGSTTRTKTTGDKDEDATVVHGPLTLLTLMSATVALLR